MREERRGDDTVDLGPGDELITFEPFYESYPAATQIAGGTFRPLRLTTP